MRDRHYDLLADHARMVHTTDLGAKLIAEAMCKNLTRIEALGWQLREEQNAFDVLSQTQERGHAPVHPNFDVAF